MPIATAIIVDDDKHVTQVFSELLEMLNLKVLGIGYNGFDAIHLFLEHKPDIVFLDVHMPELNGVDGLKIIKKISPLTKIVMITADLSDDLEKLLEKNGSPPIIFKPFNMEKIMIALEMIKVSVTINSKFKMTETKTFTRDENTA